MLSGCCYTLGRGGQLIQQVGIVCLNTVFLAAKTIDSVPERVGSAALFGLSCMSLVGLPYQYTMLQKTGADLKHSWKTGEGKTLVASAVKAAYISTSVLLNGGNFVAAVAGLLGADSLQAGLYEAMIPAGEASIAVGALLEITYLYFFWKALKQADEFPGALPLLRAEALIDDGESSEGPKKLASLIRYSMDKDTLADLIKNFEPPKVEQLSALAVKNIQTQRSVALGGKLLLSLIGYSLMAVEKYYTPNSVQSAVINEGISLLYTTDYALRLGCEVCQRNAIAAAGEDRGEAESLVNAFPGNDAVIDVDEDEDADPISCDKAGLFLDNELFLLMRGYLRV